ncbi:MAG: hypothetical protein GF344_15835, partial [Chitinivibrionales bacterium]|nr:hypothetical protein [Chitinivibrionales bacterium]MBD3358166.1 hypothetical protein [Chitinivibrionales bacterium]
MPEKLLCSVLIISLIVLNGCGEFGHDKPTKPASSGSVTVMTRNVYVGADVDLNNFEPTEMLNTFLETDFGARAKALAAEIAASEPHFVGLQEVALFRFQVPADPSSP